MKILLLQIKTNIYLLAWTISCLLRLIKDAKFQRLHEGFNYKASTNLRLCELGKCIACKRFAV